MVNKILNPGAMGDGLRHSYNQGRDDDKPQNAPQASGLNPEDEIEDKAFVSRYPDGNLYNTENDRPVRDNPPMLEPGSNRTQVTTREQTDKQLMRIKLGDNLSWKGGEGTVVSRDNMFVKIADNTDHRIDTVPVSETYFKDDMLAVDNMKDMMWDMMMQDQRVIALNKAHIRADSQKAYLYRDWLDIPEDARDIIKEGNFDGASHGGVAGREPDHSGRNEESRSFRDLTQPKHVTAPYEDKAAPAFQKDKSDVEHGVYGGVVTDIPIDATDEYEDDRPKSKPLSGAQTAANEGPSGQRGAKRTVGNEPSDPTKAPGVHERWSETRKDLDLASITGEGKKDKQIGSYPSQPSGATTMKQTEEASTTPSTVASTIKDEDRGVAESSAGFQGQKPNAQSMEKDLDLASITGEGKKDKDDSGTSSRTGPTFGSGPDRKKTMDKELDIVHKGNSRWGPQQVTEKEWADWIANN